ncbi:MAG: hypothetical protein ACKN9H_05675, partial [Methylophilaceae bacterium]
MQFDVDFPAGSGQKKFDALAAGLDAAFFAQAAQALQKSPSKAPLVIFTENAFTAQRLLEEIVWFAPDLSVHLFPDWETLPYDHFSPHPDLISERLATLYQIH